MLRVEQLVVVRGAGAEQLTVRLPQLHVPTGQVMAITGESGCGKSTLLEALGLLLRPQAVATFSLGQPSRDVATLLLEQRDSTLAQIRAEQLGFVLQSGGLLPFMSVRDNIQLTRRILSLSPSSERLERAIDTLKITPLLNKLPSALSIGERQRVAFLRAIAHEPALLLADEPTAALDPHTANTVFELFLSLVTETEMSALVVSHDWSLVRRFGLPSLTAQCEAGVTTFLVDGAHD